MSKTENFSRKVRRNKPVYDDVVPLDDDRGEKRLKGMAWLKKEYKEQNDMAEQEIESAPEKKKFSVKRLMKFKKDEPVQPDTFSSATKKIVSKKVSQQPVESLAEEQPGLIKKLGLFVVSSRRYVITVLITVVIMGGVFGAMNYFSAKDKDDSVASDKDSSLQVENSVPVQVTEKEEAVPEPVPIPLDTDNEAAGETEFLVNDEETIEDTTTDGTEVVIKDPADLLPPVDPADITVAVYNGSGVPGLAGQYAKLVEDLGFNVADVGNAESFDYTMSEINYLADADTVREKISDVLIGASQSQEKIDQEYDIILIIGKSEDAN